MGDHVIVLSIFKSGTTHKIEIKEKWDLDNFFVDEFKQTLKYGLYKDIYIIPNYKYIELSPISEQSLYISNAGGNSIYSEAISMQYFIDVFKAENIIYEMNVKYYISYKMIDFLCTFHNQRIGVSVTRAMNWSLYSIKKSLPHNNRLYEFTLDDGLKLLKKKLYGLVIARNAVIKEQRFFKSVLHIFCQTEEIAQLLRQAYEVIKTDETLENFNIDIGCHVIILLTVCQNPDIYQNTAIYQYKQHKSL